MALATEQRSLADRLIKLIASLWPMLDLERLDETWPALMSMIEGQVAREHELAARIAVAEYLAARTAAGISTMFIAPVAALGVEALRTSLTVTGPIGYKIARRRGFTPSKASRLALTQLQGAASRHALAGARDTTLQAIAADPEASGWARIPRANACAFCLLLATRGGAYRSKSSALSSKSGSSYHDHCGCVVQPLFSGTWTPPAHVQAAEELYAASTARVTGKEKVRAFERAVREQRAA